MKTVRKMIVMAAATALLWGCGGKAKDTESAQTSGTGFVEGKTGDLLQTEWFTIRVNRSSLADSYGELTPQKDGTKLLAVNVTLKNTDDTILPMYDVDFQAQWNSDAEDAFALPVTYTNPEAVQADMLKDSYTVDVGGEVSGDLVFEVPADQAPYFLLYQEVYEDEETGRIFVVELNPK